MHRNAAATVQMQIWGSYTTELTAKSSTFSFHRHARFSRCCLFRLGLCLYTGWTKNRTSFITT